MVIYVCYCLFCLLVVAENTCYLRLMRMCWNKWCQALYQKWTEEVRLEAAGHLAVRICQRRVLNRWKACILNHMKYLLKYFDFCIRLY